MSDAGAAPVRVLLIAPSLDILGGQAVQARRLFDDLRGEAGVRIDFLPINPRLAGPFGALRRIKYVRTAVTTAAFLGQPAVARSRATRSCTHLPLPIPRFCLRPRW